MNLEKRLQWFFERKLIMLFLCEERFLNPLIADELQRLTTSGLLEDEQILLVLDEVLPEFITTVADRYVFPCAYLKSA